MADELSTGSSKLFEQLKQNVNGIECWDARVLMPHVGYANWQDFHNAIKKAIQSCITRGEVVEKEFLGTSLKFPGKRGPAAKNYLLTRRACYLVFQNGDSKVPGIAAAQGYFVEQTIRQETADQRTLDRERLEARHKLTVAEREFSNTITAHQVSVPEVANIRSQGDAVLFNGNNTATMKKQLGVPGKRALADFLPTVTITAKELAAQITAFNTGKNNLAGYGAIVQEHRQNNGRVRDVLVKRDIFPERLPAEVDIKDVKVRMGYARGPRKPIAKGQLGLLDGSV